MQKDTKEIPLAVQAYLEHTVNKKDAKHDEWQVKAIISFWQWVSEEKEQLLQAIDEFAEAGLIGHRTIDLLTEWAHGRELPDPPDYNGEQV